MDGQERSVGGTPYKKFKLPLEGHIQVSNCCSKFLYFAACLPATAVPVAVLCH